MHYVVIWKCFLTTLSASIKELHELDISCHYVVTFFFFAKYNAHPPFISLFYPTVSETPAKNLLCGFYGNMGEYFIDMMGLN